jgi:hypothetical protein
VRAPEILELAEKGSGNQQIGSLRATFREFLIVGYADHTILFKVFGKVVRPYD